MGAIAGNHAVSGGLRRCRRPGRPERNLGL